MENKKSQAGQALNPALLASLTQDEAKAYNLGDMLNPEYAEKKIRYSATSGGGWSGNIHSWRFGQNQL